MIVLPDPLICALEPLGIGSADEDGCRAERGTPLELESEHVRVAGSDGLHSAELGHRSDGLGVDVRGDIEEEVPLGGLREVAGLADAELRFDPQRVESGLAFGDGDAVALGLELFTGRPDLSLIGHPLALIGADRTLLRQRGHRLHPAGPADRHIGQCAHLRATSCLEDSPRCRCPRVQSQDR